MSDPDSTLGEEQTAEPEAEDGAAIPGLAGAAISALNSKPFSALLGPTFAVLGDYWGERTRERVAAWRAKREQNLKHHRERVLNAEGFEIADQSPSEQQANLTIEWILGAQTIDPEQEEELSALWEGILVRIYRDNDDGDITDQINVLKQLNARDAIALLEFPTEWSHRFRAAHSSVVKLEKLGLIERFSTTQTFSQRAFIIAGISFVLLLLATVAFLFPSSVPEILSKRMLFPFTLLVLAVGSILSAALAVAFRIGSARLTELGLSLQLSGLRYRPTVRRKSQGA